MITVIMLANTAMMNKNTRMVSADPHPGQMLEMSESLVDFMVTDVWQVPETPPEARGSPSASTRGDFNNMLLTDCCSCYWSEHCV